MTDRIYSESFFVYNNVSMDLNLTHPLQRLTRFLLYIRAVSTFRFPAFRSTQLD